MMYDDDQMLMLSGIQHYMFCPRQWALIHIEQQQYICISTDYRIKVAPMWGCGLKLGTKIQKSIDIQSPPCGGVD